MAEITIQLPTNGGRLAVIEEHLVYGEGYVDTVPNPNYKPELPEDPITNPVFIPNPVGKLDFLNNVAKNILVGELKRKIRNKKMEEAEAEGELLF